MSRSRPSHVQRHLRLVARAIWFAGALGASTAARAEAQVSLGDIGVSGHVGFALPLATFTSGTGVQSTTTLNDNFTIVFPFGIGLRPQGSPVVFDFEFVPEVHTVTRNATLLVHPGVILPLGDGYAVGLRAAFEIDQHAVGFTPLVAKAFPIGTSHFKWFLEGDLPVRFGRTPVGNDTTSVGIVFHTGVAF